MEIKVNLLDGRRVSASIGSHVVVTDQPKTRGGGDTALSPFHLFLASLATCSGYYLYDLCLTRDIPADGLQLVMRTERDEASRMVTRIEIEIQLPPEFPEKYDRALVRAVDLCSVKKHLIDAPTFETYTTRIQAE